jgi:UPF0755 protein
MFKSVTLKAGLIIVFSFFFATFSFYAYQILFTENIQVGKPDTVLYIPKGATFQQVVDSLEMNEILHDKLSFMFLAKLSGYKKDVKPGRYLLKSNSTNKDLFKMLIKGRQTPLKLTFNNIRLKSELITKLSDKLEMSPASLEVLFNNPSFTKKYGFDTNTFMAMFIPNTYEVYWTISPEELVEKINQSYQNFWTNERLSKAKAIQLSPIQVAILASIVEEETKMNDEKPMVARVYLNRLRSDMRLQADPTVKFAIGDFTLKRVSNLSIESPYNTYKYKGLPPGLICLPMNTSIDAVLNPAKHDYMFFCADFDKPGYHLFRKTFEEHRIIGVQYRNTLDKLKIK